VSDRQLNTAHPEGQRDRPEEAPATGVSHVNRIRETATITVPIPTRTRDR
jgi:hypothetical protein